MAELTTQEVLKLARLARLKLSKEEIEQFRKEISEILAYVEQLDKVNTDKLEPTYQVTGLTNVTREDVVKDYGTTQKDLLKNVPELEGDYIKVKRVLE